MNSEQYHELFRELMVYLEAECKKELMQGIAIGVLVGLDDRLDPDLRVELLTTISYIAVTERQKEDLLFKKIKETVQPDPVEEGLVLDVLKQLLKQGE